MSARMMCTDRLLQGAEVYAGPGTHNHLRAPWAHRNIDTAYALLGSSR